MTDPASVLIADRFQRGLRLAAFGVLATVLFGWHLPVLVASVQVYRPLSVELSSFLIVAAVVVVMGVQVARARPWGRLRWPLFAVVSAASVAATVAVPRGELIGSVHWSWEIFGWFAVLLLLDLPVWALVLSLAANLAFTATAVAFVDGVQRRSLVGLAIGTLAIAGWQVAASAAAGALRRTATATAQIAAEEEQLRTAELVAEQLHRDRQVRYAAIAATTGPLLTGLSTGELDPADRDVRRACMIEAARMRRLFAESDDHADPLEHEVLACVEIAERRGVAIHIDVRGVLPALPIPVRRALTEPAIRALAEASSSARVTIAGDDDRVVLSVVAAGVGDAAGAAGAAGTAGAEPAESPTPGSVRVTWMAQGSVAWMEATWTRAGTCGP
ncbi:hypothetical protein [Frankia sp. Cr1]|uniref:hypothetical protein n=1 Tax=Frankia sp. Cr1 TaxID=3073931 RepID=UPI002AD4ECBB|nr:hypothetical protein [Frankia sp. Cr1]